MFEILKAKKNTLVQYHSVFRFHKKNTYTSEDDIWRTFQEGKSGRCQTTGQTGASMNLAQDLNSNSIFVISFKTASFDSPLDRDLQNMF